MMSPFCCAWRCYKVSSHRLCDPLNMHKSGQYERKNLRTERPYSNMKVRMKYGSKLFVLYSIVVILWILSKILLANIAGSKKYLTFDSENEYRRRHRRTVWSNRTSCMGARGYKMNNIREKSVRRLDILQSANKDKSAYCSPNVGEEEIVGAPVASQLHPQSAKLTSKLTSKYEIPVSL
jgi:hypothetical protein